MTEIQSREDNIYFARLSEQGERYGDMVKYMKAVSKVSPHPDSRIPSFIPSNGGLIENIVRPRVVHRREESVISSL